MALGTLNNRQLVSIDSLDHGARAAAEPERSPVLPNGEIANPHSVPSVRRSSGLAHRAKTEPLDLARSPGGPVPNAYSTRRVPREEMRWLLDGDYQPRAGDLVLARIEALGHHTRLQLPNGRRRQLFEGDDVIVAYADRYAPQQFEAHVPANLGRCHLVAGGGVASQVLSQHQRIRRGATLIRPLGLIAADRHGPQLNTRDFALPRIEPRRRDIPIVAVLGTAMDSGKTTTAAFFARGLSRYGMRVGYAKVTGTGASGDPTLVVDAGADPVLDFTDIGLVSTYRVGEREIEEVFLSLIAHLQQANVDVILLEVADGLFQQETAALVGSPRFSDFTDAVLFAAGDAMGAAAGVTWLRERGHRLLGLAGTLEAAPLQAREAEAATGVPVFRRSELGDPHTAARVFAQIRPSRR
ncbi:MAG: DUF1611 domain-containing protein [Gemmatimonadota bacterium]|nr:DUF1611 domain-containing protein [Gemmatimonadota bacterium]